MYQCEICNFKSSRKTDFTRHTESERHRVRKYDIERQETLVTLEHLRQNVSALEKENVTLVNNNTCLRQENESLKLIVKDLSRRPTINNTFNIIQPIVLSSMKFEDVCSVPLLMKGSYNAFYVNLYNNIFLDKEGNSKAVCTDYARKIVKWKNEEGEIITDQKLRQFIGLYQNQYWEPLGCIRDDIFQIAEKNNAPQKLLKSLETVYLSGPEFVRFMIDKTYKKGQSNEE